MGALALAFGVLVGVAAASTPGADVRLTHDANDPDSIAVKIRFAANRALGIYEVSSQAEHEAGKSAAK